MSYNVSYESTFVNILSVLELIYSKCQIFDSLCVEYDETIYKKVENNS